MFVLRSAQRNAISREVEMQYIKALVENIHIELCAQAGDVMKGYEKSATVTIISDTFYQCTLLDIVDEDQIMNICLIRLLTNADILTMDAFSYVLRNELMHPFAKARHLILSFFAVSSMTRGT